MKKIMFLILFLTVLFVVHGQIQRPDYLLMLDFTAEQDNLPYPSYAAAYLVNNTDKALEFTFFYKSMWGSAYIGGYSLAELMFDVVVDSRFRNNTFTLQPGNKVRVFSAAFNSENKNNPRSYITGDVLVNGERKTVSAFIDE